MNFEKLTIDLHNFIIFLIFIKFQENQRSKVISSIEHLNFKFLWSKIIHEK